MATNPIADEFNKTLIEFAKIVNEPRFTTGINTSISFLPIHLVRMYHLHMCSIYTYDAIENKSDEFVDKFSKEDNVFTNTLDIKKNWQLMSEKDRRVYISHLLKLYDLALLHNEHFPI